MLGPVVLRFYKAKLASQGAREGCTGTELADCGEQRLEHCEEAQKFYRDLATQGKKVRAGMEASGHARWFEQLLGD